MVIEIRHPAEDELRAAMEATHVTFADPLSDENFERHRKMLPLDRFYAAYDDGVPVGTAADYPFIMTVPGGELATAGVTWVGVLPSHRRRGILTQMMRQELATCTNAASRSRSCGRPRQRSTVATATASPPPLRSSKRTHAVRPAGQPGVRGAGADHFARRRARAVRAGVRGRALGGTRLHGAVAGLVGDVPTCRPGGVAARREPEVRGDRRARRRACRVRALPHQAELAAWLLTERSASRGNARLEPRCRARALALHLRHRPDRARRGTSRPGVTALPDGRRSPQPATAHLRGPVAAPRRRWCCI